MLDDYRQIDNEQCIMPACLTVLCGTAGFLILSLPKYLPQATPSGHQVAPLGNFANIDHISRDLHSLLLPHNVGQLQISFWFFLLNRTDFNIH